MRDADQTQENPDDRVMTIEIDCAGCGAVLRSAFKFRRRDRFDLAIVIGNKLRCLSCGEMTACDKENMRVVYEDGSGLVSGFVGHDVPPKDGGQ